MTRTRRNWPAWMPADADLWRQVARTVRPLGRARPSPPATIESAGAIPPGPQDEQARVVPDRDLTRTPMASVTPTAGLDRGTARKLRRGAIAIEARLDLHGLTRDTAHAALDRFLGRSRRSGRRCVLVITGKGGRRPDHGDDAPFMRRDGPGVLRRLVPLWLETGTNRHRVLAYHPARPGDGGDGAFYVLLRRRHRGPVKE